MKKNLWKKFTVPLAAVSVILPITSPEVFAQTSDVKDSTITNSTDQTNNVPLDSDSTNPTDDNNQNQTTKNTDTSSTDTSSNENESSQNQSTSPTSETDQTNQPNSGKIETDQTNQPNSGTNETDQTNQPNNGTNDTTQTPSEEGQNSDSSHTDETNQNNDTTKPPGEEDSNDQTNNDKDPTSHPDDSAETPETPNTPPSDIPTENQDGTTDKPNKPDSKPNHNTDNQGGSSSSTDNQKPNPNHHESQSGQSGPGEVKPKDDTPKQNYYPSGSTHQSQQSNVNDQNQNQSTINRPSYQSQNSNWENHLNGLTQNATNQSTFSSGYMVPFTKVNLSSDRFGHLVSGALKYNPYIVDQVSQLSENQEATSKDVDAMLKPRQFASNAELNQLQQNTGYFKYQYFNPHYAQTYYDNLDLQILGLVTGEIGSMSDLKVNNHKVHHKNHASVTKTKVNKKVNKEDEHEKAKTSEKHHLRYGRLLTSVIVAFGVVFIGFLGLMLIKRKKKNIEE